MRQLVETSSMERETGVLVFKPASVRGTCMFDKLYWSCYQNVPFRLKKEKEGTSGTRKRSQRVSGRICHINVLYCLESK